MALATLETAFAAIIRTLKDIDAAKPLLVKIAPDLAADAVPEETNQTGGLSGAPLLSRSTEVLRILRAHTKLPIIASGGVMGGEAAREKREAGASLVQIYTGFIYSGPQLIRDIVAAWG